MDRDRLLNEPMSFIPDDLLDDIIVKQFSRIRGIGMNSRVMTEISNVMGWETHIDTNHYHCDLIQDRTASCFTDICIDIVNRIPNFKVLLHDPDELIELVRSQLNDETLRAKIKEDIEYVCSLLENLFTLSFGE